MGMQDIRTIAGVKNGWFSTSGRRRVHYRDINGKTRTGKVIGAGSVSGIKIQIRLGGSPSNNQILDNVPLMTARNQTNVYMNRQLP